jgi:rhodanese-related sulfurtransferase
VRSEPQQVSTAEAARLLRDEGYIYLDVRRVEEFELGHVHGAFNLPWLEALEALEAPGDFLALVGARFGLRQGLVVGCQSGARSRDAGRLLATNGFERVVDHSAGFGGRRDAFGKLIEPGWERAGQPVSYDAEPGRSYRELLEGGAASSPESAG